MCVLLITRLLRGVGRWARKPVNHTSWVAVVTPTDRPKSVRNCCLIELFCGVVCVVTLSLWHFCWYRGFCHRTGSDLLLFVFRAARLSSKLLGQGYVMERLKSSLRKFYGRYGDLIKHYEVSLSQMLHDILGHDRIQWHPQLIRHNTNLRTYYRTGLYYQFWPYYQILEVSIEHCNGCG